MLASLTKKMLRDLWALRLQVGAITMVVACGVAVFILSLSTLRSLETTREHYYRAQNFADIFVKLKRAPLNIVERIKMINGVQNAHASIAAYVNVELSGFKDPIQGLLLSHNDRKLISLNKPYLTKGRYMSKREEEIVINDAFFKAHKLKLNDSFYMIINGKKRKFIIVGAALSPEHIYQIAPGTIFPDYKRYAIIWMGENAFAHAYGMDGAFNNLSVSLLPGTNPQGVINQIDQILSTYGGLGAYARNDQLSHRFLQEEFKQLRTMAFLFPLMFFGIAAFLLNVFIQRLVQTEREQIAILKAFGYANLQIMFYYFRLTVVLVLLGILVGVAVGVWMGHGLSQIYSDFYKFPYLYYRLDFNILFFATLFALSSTLVGSLIATQRAYALAPAEGMRPDPPGKYNPSVMERSLSFIQLNYVTKMLWRNIERRPFKSLLTLLGIACAGGILIVGSFQEDAVRHMVDVQFRLSQREDIQVSLAEGISYDAINSLNAINGVYLVEAQRSAPVRLSFGHKTYLTSLEAVGNQQKLRQILDFELKPITMPDDGILMSDYYRNKLGIKTGDVITVEFLEGKKKIKSLEVVGFVKEYVGMGAYVSFKTLFKLLQEGANMNGILLSVDKSKTESILKKLNEMPKIMGITLKDNAVINFLDTFAQTILIFTFFISLFAAVLAFGLVLNNALISFSEKSRELATLRVLGFTSLEVTRLLLGEMAIITLIAIPAGFVVGVLLCKYLVSNLQSELYRVPLILTKGTFAYSCLIVVVASLLSGTLLFRKTLQLNLVATLKAKE